jgi:predicted ATPase
MLAHLPDTRDRDGLELTLLVTLGGSLLVTDGYTAEDVKRTYVRARELCAALGDRPEWFPVLWGLWSYHECIGEHRTAAELAAELVRMAEHRRPADRARAGWALGTTTVFLGDPAGALGHLAWGLEYYREEDDRPDRHLYGHDAGISCQCFIAWALTLIGRHGEALGAIEQVRERAAGLGHAQSLAFATLFSSMVYQACGEGERALAGATAAVEIAEREGLPLYREWSAGVRGWALATLGRTDEGLALVSGAIAALRALGSHIALPYFMLLHADALAATQSDRAIDVLHDALRQSEASGERHYRAEILRFEAEIRARLNDVPAAVALATQAVEVAAEQGALGLMDRASATLERLTVEGVGIGGED